MMSQLWMWLAAGTLILLTCGCAGKRTAVATIEPTFSHRNHLSADATATWDDPPLRDSANVPSALAETRVMQP